MDKIANIHHMPEAGKVKVTLKDGTTVRYRTDEGKILVDKIVYRKDDAKTINLPAELAAQKMKVMKKDAVGQHSFYKDINDGTKRKNIWEQLSDGMQAKTKEVNGKTYLTAIKTKDGNYKLQEKVLIDDKFDWKTLSLSDEVAASKNPVAAAAAAAANNKGSSASSSSSSAANDANAQTSSALAADSQPSLANRVKSSLSGNAGKITAAVAVAGLTGLAVSSAVKNKKSDDNAEDSSASEFDFNENNSNAFLPSDMHSFESSSNTAAVPSMVI